MMSPGQYRDRAKDVFRMGGDALDPEAKAAFMSAGNDWLALADYAEVQDQLLRDLAGPP